MGAQKYFSTTIALLIFATWLATPAYGQTGDLSIQSAVGLAQAIADAKPVSARIEERTSDQYHPLGFTVVVTNDDGTESRVHLYVPRAMIDKLITRDGLLPVQFNDKSTSPTGELELKVTDYPVKDYPGHSRIYVITDVGYHKSFKALPQLIFQTLPDYDAMASEPPSKKGSTMMKYAVNVIFDDGLDPKDKNPPEFRYPAQCVPSLSCESPVQGEGQESGPTLPPDTKAKNNKSYHGNSTGAGEIYPVGTAGAGY
jgi:hypothetical protein